MSKLIDLTGKKFNRLTVLERDANTKQGEAKWICLCDCGNLTSVRGSALRNGHTKSCGCLSKEKVVQRNKEKPVHKNLTGQRFEKLLCLEKTDKRSASGSVIWKCLCDCGNIIEVSQNLLTRGHVKSCGCLKKFKDLTNKKFGKLIAIKPTDKRRVSDKCVIWECLCDCGNICEVASSNLINGLTQSCGCLKSKGENKIKEILQILNISFIQQHIFNDCVYEKPLPFDFYLPDHNCCIEYNGEQHYYPIEHFGGDSRFKIQQIRDNIKKDYCKKHNMVLIIIPYWDLKYLNKEYLKEKICATTNYI